MDLDLILDNDVDAEDVDVDADTDAADLSMASAAAQLGSTPRTMSSNLQQVLDGDIKADDAKVWSRVDGRFTIPENFSTEMMQNNCRSCLKKHARNLCCRSLWGKKHSGALEFMSWGFDPKLAARAKQQTKGKTSSLC